MLPQIALFLFTALQYSIMCTFHVFICSCVDGRLGRFHLLAVVDSAAKTIGVHVSFQIMVFSGYVPRRGITESHANSIFSFLLRDLHTKYNKSYI